MPANDFGDIEIRPAVTEGVQSTLDESNVSVWVVLGMR